jgi:hypothetical protein
LHVWDEKNTKMHIATVAQFQGREEELKGYLDWFRTLPVRLRIITPKGEVRAVHDVWDNDHYLDGLTLTDDTILEKIFKYGDENHVKAYRRATKGVKVYLPKGMGWPAAEWNGTTDHIRAKWWLDAKGKTYREMAFIPKEMAHLPPNIIIPDGQAAKVKGYDVNEPIVFTGHYWISPDDVPAPLAENVVCVDYSAGRTGPAVAYRWDGEAKVDANKFVTSNDRSFPQALTYGRRIQADRQLVNCLN